MCELKYEKKFDPKGADFTKMRVKEMRKICDDEGIDTKGARRRERERGGGEGMRGGYGRGSTFGLLWACCAGLVEKDEFVKKIKAHFNIKDEV